MVRTGDSTISFTPTAAARWKMRSQLSTSSAIDRHVRAGVDDVVEALLALEVPDVVDAAGGQVVDDEDLVAALQQLVRQVRPDEARAAGDQITHQTKILNAACPLYHGCAALTTAGGGEAATVLSSGHRDVLPGPGQPGQVAQPQLHGQQQPDLVLVVGPALGVLPEHGLRPPAAAPARRMRASGAHTRSCDVGLAARRGTRCPAAGRSPSCPGSGWPGGIRSAKALRRMYLVVGRGQPRSL